MRQHPYEKAMAHAHAMQGDMDKRAKAGFFNPAYKPHAKRCFNESVAEATVEEELSGEDWSRPKRAARRREIYDSKMTAHEALT